MGIYMGKHTNFVNLNAHTVISWKDEICEIRNMTEQPPSTGNVLPCQV